MYNDRQLGAQIDPYFIQERDAGFYVMEAKAYTGGLMGNTSVYWPIPQLGQAGGLAVRVEWPYPGNSRNWRFTYIQSRSIHHVAQRAQRDIADANLNFAKCISMIQWLFGATPNHHYFRIPHCDGVARVLQIHEDHHNQRVLAKKQKLFFLFSRLPRPIDAVIADMDKVGLQHVNF